MKKQKLTPKVTAKEINPATRELAAAPPETGNIIISGKLTKSDGTVVSNATVIVFKKMLRNEDPLGEAVTNTSGSYEISIANTGTIDMMVRAFDGEKEVAAAGPFFRIVHSKTVNLVVDNKSYKGPAEHKQLFEKVTEKLEGIKLSALTLDEVTLLSGKTGISTIRLTTMAAAESLSDKHGISKDFFYGLINSDFKADINSLAIQPDKVISNTIKRAADKNQIPEEEAVDSTITENITKLRTAAAKQTLTPVDLRTSTYWMLKITSLSEELKEKFLVTLYKNSNNSTKTYEELQSDTDFKKSNSLNHLKKIFEIGSLTANYSTLVNVINKKLTGATTLSSFSLYSKEDWLAFIKENGTAVPQATEGKNLEEKEANFSEMLTRNFEKAFPGEKVKGKILAKNKNDDLQKFFDNAPDFDIGKTQINTYIKKNESTLKQKVTDLDAVKNDLKTWQRLYRITPDEDKYEKIEILKKSGADSASWIASKFSRTGFTQKFSGQLGEGVAGEIYDKVSLMATSTVAAAAAVTTKLKDVGLAVIGTGTSSNSEIDIPDWETLFGTSSYCECEECRSVLSPAAYLVDLLQFINIDPDSNNETYKDKLLKRRPDLGNILLSCENTNTALPYIDLLNEVLENGVLLINGKTTDYTYQTTGTTQELQAMPEHINDEAYFLISAAVYPFNMPFAFSNKEGNAYIEKLGFMRHELLRVLQYNGGSNEPTDLSVALVHLGLSSNEKKIIAGEQSITIETTDSFGRKILAIKIIKKGEFYGFDKDEWDASLSNVETFLDLTGLSYDDLLKLLQVKFVNPDSTVTVDFDSASDCDVSTATLKNADDNFFERTHRFLRLIKVLEWDILDAGKTIDATGESNLSDFTDNFFIKLSAIKYLKEKLEIELIELLSWWSNLNTDTDINDSESRSFYQELFLNMAVSNPPEEVFALNSDKTKLVDEDATPGKLSDYTSLIAGALNISSTDLALLMARLADDNLTLSNLSLLHRMSSAAKAFDLDVDEFLVLLDLFPVNPFSNLEKNEALLYYEYVTKIKESGFSVSQLDYVLRNNSTLEDSGAPAISDIGDIFSEIQSGVVSIKSENNYTSDPTGEVIQTKLQQILDEETATEAIGLINKDSALTEAEIDLIIAKLSFLETTAKNDLLTIDSDATRSTYEKIQSRYAYLLTPLLNYVIKAQTTSLIAQLFSEEFEIDLDTATLLLTELVFYKDGIDLRVAVDLLCDDKLLNYDFSSYAGISTDLATQYNTYLLLHKVSILISGFGFTNEETKWIYQNGANAGWLNLNELPLAASDYTTNLFTSWRIMYEFSTISSEYRSDDLILMDILTQAINAADINIILAQLSGLTGWDLNDLTILAGGKYGISDVANLKDGQVFYKFYEIAQFTSNAGISADTLWSWSGVNLDQDESSGIIQAAKAKYSINDWLSVAPGLRNKLRPLQRDALTGYILANETTLRKKIYGEADYNNWSVIQDENDLIDFFLIDVKMESDFLTARIKQACSSVQMFIQRSFMGLEPDVSLDDDLKEQWKWMKNYRLWEANRKVFLWPENWTEPELRTTKTEIFEVLESDLLQDEINDENVERALVRYLESVADISNLVICGTYYDSENNTDSSGSDNDDIYSKSALNIPTGILHVFGRTQNDPYEYYYRTFDYSLEYWTPWEKIELEIDSPTLTPIIHNNRLYLFWLVFKENSLSSSEFEEEFNGHAPFSNLYYDDSANDSALFINDIDNRDESFKYYEINLAYSIYKFDKWKPKKISSGSIASDNMYAAINYYIKTQNAEMEDFFIVISKSEDILNLNVIQFIGAATHSFRSVSGTLTMQELAMFPFDSSEFPENFEDYELVNGVFILYNDDPADYTTEEYYAIGEFCFNTDDSNLFLESTSCKKQDIYLPDDLNPTVHYVATKYNMIWGNIVAWDIKNDIGLNYLWLISSVSPIEILQKTSSTYLIPLSSQNNGVFYGKDFFYMDSDTDARYFVRYYNMWSLYNDFSYYKFTSAYHPYIKEVLKAYLQYDDIASMFDRDLQMKSTLSISFLSKYAPASAVSTPYPNSQFDFDYGTPFYRYNWEFFYHIPMLIADYLSQEQQFEQAQQWYHYIFDPTDRSNKSVPKKYWQLKPFYENQDTDDIYDLLYALSYSGSDSDILTKKTEVEAQIKAWETNAFEPHVIAELRITAYMKNTVMKYLDNLIAWGDYEFGLDTIESINSATQIYILALEILGDKPEEIPTETSKDYTYNELLEQGLDSFSNTLVLELETYSNVDFSSFSFTPASGKSSLSSYKSKSVQLLNFSKSLYFCVPFNDTLLSYWDTVEDRLFKIRNCMNIEGVTRSLVLYEPAIDPGILVSAKAAGVDLGTILSDINSPLPNYRFRFFIQKAIQFCSDVQALGNAFLSALEKKDAEELALLRGSQELNLLQAVKDLKKLQVDEAEENYDALVKSKELAEIRYDYYKDIVKISEKEQLNLKMLDKANVFTQAGSAIDLLASVLHKTPQLYLGPFPLTATGGDSFGQAASASAAALRAISAQYSFEANKNSINAAYDRRWDDWKLQEDLAAKEMEQLDKQIAAAEVRKSIAEKDLENTELQIDQSKEVYEWMTDKYTNQELYKWMSTQLSKLYFQSYKLAYDCAKRAQRAFQYELASDQTYIVYGYWDSLKKGLLAGEGLLYDLKRMEIAYYEQNKRTYELTKNVSLAQFTPSAILNLRAKGDCFVEIPEVLFDMDYPGHYMRRIKSVSLSIPCVAGPYTTIACTLTMVNNKYRNDPSASSDYTEDITSGYDSRFAYNQTAIQSIATSSAQRDNGLFQLIYEDDRYLPFEGAGAITTWRIQLPNDFRQFDYDTISDIIIHISYTAKDGGETLKTKAIDNLSDIVSDKNTQTLYKLFSLKHDFPTDFYKMQSGTATTYNLKIGKSIFPYFARNKTITLLAIPQVFNADTIDVGSVTPSTTITSSNDDTKEIKDDWELILNYTMDEIQSVSDVLIVISYAIS